MEIQTLLARLRRGIFIGMPLALSAEFICGVLGPQKIVSLSSAEWMLLRNTVAFGTGSVITLIIVRLSTQSRYLKTYWCSLLIGILSLVFFLLPYLFQTVLPDILWAGLSYCGALVSFVVLASAEYRLPRKPMLRQQKALAYPAKSQERVTIVEAVRTIFQEKVEAVPPTIIILHSSKDALWMGKCHDQFGIFEVRGMVALWDENSILPGSVRQDELEHALDFAKVAILLVSARFLIECAMQLERILHYQKNRPDFWVCPIIVSVCPYEQSPLREIHPYWSPANTAKDPLHKLPRHKQDESFYGLARLITNRLFISTTDEVSRIEGPSQVYVTEEIEVLPTTEQVSLCRIEELSQEPLHITEEDKALFPHIKEKLEEKGLSSHYCHAQHTNEEYLKYIQSIIESPNPTEEDIEWVKEAMIAIMGDTLTAA